MGLFSLFSRKKAKEAGAEAPTLLHSPSGMSADAFDALNGRERVDYFAQQLRIFAADCQDVGMRIDRDGNSCELRARYQGRPISIEVDDDGHSDLRLGFQNTIGYFTIAAGDGEVIEGNFPREPTEILAYALAPGVMLSAFGAYLDRDLQAWSSLPESMRARIIERAVQDGRTVSASHQSLYSSALIGPTYHRPVKETLQAEFSELWGIAEALSGGKAPVEPRSQVALGGAFQTVPIERIVCAYCSSRFVIERKDPRCPVCGAPGG